MRKITVIGSLHDSNNNVNENTLYEILLGIQPDVIFEEIPPDIFSDVYSNKRQDDGVEVSAVKTYLKQKDINHYPIDIPHLPQIATECDANAIESSIIKILKDTNCNTKLVSSLSKIRNQMYEFDMNGYSKINSKSYIKLVESQRKIVDKILYGYYPNMYYANKYENDFHFILRENYMAYRIANLIQEYGNAILLIGSLHLGTIIKKLRKQLPKYKIEIYKKK